VGLRDEPRHRLINRRQPRLVTSGVAVANLLVRCDGSLPPRELLVRAAAATGAPADTVARKGAAATRHLIEAGFLLPS
jgi:hypothetical protein